MKHFIERKRKNYCCLFSNLDLWSVWYRDFTAYLSEKLAQLLIIKPKILFNLLIMLLIW